ADRVHRVRVRGPVADRLGLVLDAEAALEIQSQLPFELARVDRPRRRPDHGDAHGHDVQEDGEQTEHDDEQWGRSTHRGEEYRSRREAAAGLPAVSGPPPPARPERL